MTERDTVFTVTVDKKNSTHPYYRIGSERGFFVNGTAGGPIMMIRGQRYIFDITAPGSTFYLTTSDRGGVGFPELITIFPPTQNGRILYVPSADVPTNLHYQSGNQEYMGGVALIFDNQDDLNLHRDFINLRQSENALVNQQLQIRLDFLQKIQGFLRHITVRVLPRFRADILEEIRKGRAGGTEMEGVRAEIQKSLMSVQQHLDSLDNRVDDFAGVVDSQLESVATGVGAQIERIRREVEGIHTELAKTTETSLEMLREEIAQADTKAEKSAQRALADTARKITAQQKTQFNNLEESVAIQISAVFRTEESRQKKTLHKTVLAIVDPIIEEKTRRMRAVNDIVSGELIKSVNAQMAQTIEILQSTTNMRTERLTKEVDSLKTQVASLKALVERMLRQRSQDEI